MDVNIKALRIFVQVMRDLSFSQAARSLSLTQPTISQQIGRLEDLLEVKLFERVGHDIIPTESAKDFYEFALSMTDQMDQFVGDFKGHRTQLKGLVRYAMPESCQWTPHYKKIMATLKDYPDLQFEVDILSNEKITEGILHGRFDFGFVAGEKITPELKFEKFSQENYLLVAADKSFLTSLNKKGASWRLITFPGWEPFFMNWARTHGYWGSYKSSMQKSAVHVGTLAGAIHAVKAGAGIGVFPSQCVSDDLLAKELFELQSSKGPAFSPIFLSRKVGARLSKRVEFTMDLLRKVKLE